MAAHDQDTHELREQYVDQLGEQALELIRKMASASMCSTIEVVDALREQLHAEIERDLVEVAPGVTLGSVEAARYFERKRRQAECERCQLEDTASWLDGDEYAAQLPRIESTLHSCHIENGSTL